MAKSSIDTALAKIDADIADLQRARAILVASDPPATVTEKKPRKTRKPRGLPAVESNDL